MIGCHAYRDVTQIGLWTYSGRGHAGFELDVCLKSPQLVLKAQSCAAITHLLRAAHPFTALLNQMYRLTLFT
jgi:hypothetical protein